MKTSVLCDLYLAGDIMPDTLHFKPVPNSRYLTLSEARALECNGCGDCCDSRRGDYLFEWGSLPKHQYRQNSSDGEPLIIPLDLVTLEPREWEPEDQRQDSHTYFKCAAFCSNSDGSGSCTAYETRPDRCHEFPVYGKGIREHLKKVGRYYSSARMFPKCTWYDVIIVKEGCPLLKIRHPDGRLDRSRLTPEIRDELSIWKDSFNRPKSKSRGKN